MTPPHTNTPPQHTDEELQSLLGPTLQPPPFGLTRLQARIRSQEALHRTRRTAILALSTTALAVLLTTLWLLSPNPAQPHTTHPLVSLYGPQHPIRHTLPNQPHTTHNTAHITHSNTTHPLSLKTTTTPSGTLILLTQPSP